MIRRQLQTIALLSLAIRLVAIIAPGLPPARIWEDAAIAHNVAAGHGYSHHRYYGPTAVKAPAYPLLLVPVAALANESGPSKPTFLVLAGLLNAVLGAVATLFVGILGVRLYGNGVGLCASILLALHPSVAYLARVPESTNLSIALVCGAVLTLHWAANELTTGTAARIHWLFAGFVSGVAALSNPVSLPALGLTAIVWGRRRPPAVALFIVALAATLTPWTVRNYLAFDRFVAIKSPLWLDVYAGLQPEHLGGRVVLPAELVERVELRVFGLPELEREVIYAAELRPWLLANTRLVVQLAGWRIGQLWGLYGQRDRAGSALDLPLRLAPEIGYLVLTFAAIPVAWQRNRRAAIVLVSFLLVYTSVYAAIVAINVRYHLEVVWAQMILAGVAVECLWRRLTGTRGQKDLQTSDRI